MLGDALGVSEAAWATTVSAIAGQGMVAPGMVETAIVAVGSWAVVAVVAAAVAELVGAAASAAVGAAEAAVVDAAAGVVVVAAVVEVASGDT